MEPLIYRALEELLGRSSGEEVRLHRSGGVWGMRRMLRRRAEGVELLVVPCGVDSGELDGAETTQMVHARLRKTCARSVRRRLEEPEPGGAEQNLCQEPGNLDVVGAPAQNSEHENT